MVFISHHASLSVLKGRHEYNKKEYSWCTDEDDAHDDIVSQKFNHQNPSAPKKNTEPVVA